MARRLGDGGWSWFADARAVFHIGAHRRTYIGWVSRTGEIVVASFDHGTRHVEKTVLKHGLTVDDHNNPGLLVHDDGRISAFYCQHDGPHMWYRRTRHPEDVRTWGPEHRFPRNTAHHFGYTYPIPLHLRAENRTYLWWRGGNWWPAFARHTPGGRWSVARNLLHIKDQRPYVKLHSNGEDTIHIAYTEGNPGSFANSIYYLRYHADAFFHADGTRVARLRDLPVAPPRGGRVYDVDSTGERAWVWDVAADFEGHPVVVFATFPSGRAPVYHYAAWDGHAWHRHVVTDSGGGLPEGHYAAGITLDHEDPRVVFLSRKIGGRFVVERWRTSDRGATWAHRALSHQPGDAIRPISPRNRADELEVLWMQGTYDGFFEYHTNVMARVP